MIRAAAAVLGLVACGACAGAPDDRAAPVAVVVYEAIGSEAAAPADCNVIGHAEASAMGDHAPAVAELQTTAQELGANAIAIREATRTRRVDPETGLASGLVELEADLLICP